MGITLLDVLLFFILVGWTLLIGKTIVDAVLRRIRIRRMRRELQKYVVRLTPEELAEIREARRLEDKRTSDEALDPS